MCSYVHGIPWRTWATAFTGEEQTPEDIPGWVADLVIKAQFGFVKELKSAFVLKAEPASGLPALLQSKLNAPRILQVHKVGAGWLGGGRGGWLLGRGGWLLGPGWVGWVGGGV